MILRDIVAKLSLDLDKTAFKEADLSIASLTKRFAGLEGKIALAASVFGAYKLTEFASDAQETMNVLEASFGSNTESVKRWASTTAEAAQRSEFELREMAGTLGAVLNPMMEGNQDAAAKMSTRFAELAVDLGSFYNANDLDALAALRSGLTGEAEPLKRFGVVMNVATLEAFALSKGINKNVKDMTNAEKTALRYDFILEQTALAHGDAAKTSEGWANASKGLMAVLKDLAVRAGQILLPAAEKLVRLARDGVRTFLKFAQNSNVLKAALIVLGAVAVAVFKSIVVAALPVLIPMAKMIAVMTLATIVLNDLLNMFEGGDSVIADFINAIFGPGSATEAVTNLKMAWEGFTLYWANEVIPGWQSLISIFRNTIGDLKEWFADLFGTVRGWITGFLNKFNLFVAILKKNIEAMADFLGFEFKFSTTKASKKAQDEDEYFERKSYAERQKSYKKKVKDLKARTKEERRVKRAAQADEQSDEKRARRRGAQSRERASTREAERRSKRLREMRAETAAQQRYIVNIQFAGQKPTMANPFSQSAGPVTINQTLAVNVAGNASAKEARTIAETASKSVRNENRKTLAALTQRAS